MARRLRTVLLATVVLAAAPGLESPAVALSCLGTNGPPPDPYETHPVVLEGIALSGPSDHGMLGSPARMLVLRWVRGTGPRIVRVETAVQLGVGPYSGHAPGLFDPQAGTVARLFSDRARNGVLRPNPCVFGDDRPGPRTPLRAVPLSATMAGSGRQAWRAFAQNGPRGLHCVSTHPVGRHTGGQSECELGRRPLLAVHHEGPARNDIESTAITVAGPGIAEARLSTPDGAIVLRRQVLERPLLAVLPGRVDAAEVRARVTMADGTVQWLQPVGFPTSLTPDPEGGRPWYSMLDRTRHGACVGVHQVWPRDEPPGEDGLSVEGTPLCRDLRRTPFVHAVSAARPFHDIGSEVVPAPERTVVFGIARRPVRAVAITHGSDVRRLKPGRGGQFVTVYPASVRRADLIIRAER